MLEYFQRKSIYFNFFFTKLHRLRDGKFENKVFEAHIFLWASYLEQ